jgi:hypothetical protein
MQLFRHADPRFPFLWEDPFQPPGRWHGDGEGPVHSFADTPDGVWAEFLRHEEIREAEDLEGIRRALWVVEVEDLPDERPRLPRKVLQGGLASWPACRAEAARLRRRGAEGLTAPSAALLPGGARGWRVDGGLQPGPPREGEVVVLFGRRPDLLGWCVTDDGRPPEEVLGRVRYW